MKFLRIAALAAALISSPALADRDFAVTPSGATEALFDASAHQTEGMIASKCMDVRWQVTASSDTQVTCEAPLNAGQSILGQLLMGNSYSTPPRRFIQFNIVDIDGTSRVQASAWMELQMAFGQVRRTDITGASFHNSIQGFLIAAGGRFPPGTTFPNHAVLGVDGAYVTEGRTTGYRVNSIVTGSSAAAGGIRVGDLLTKIANKRFHNDDGFLDAWPQRPSIRPTTWNSSEKDRQSMFNLLERSANRSSPRWHRHALRNQPPPPPLLPSLPH